LPWQPYLLKLGPGERAFFRAKSSVFQVIKIKLVVNEGTLSIHV
jgi:hypothetical protein